MHGEVTFPASLHLGVMSNPSTLPYETRQAALERAAAALCPTGAPDDVARKVLDSVMPWYLHPEVQVRPRVLGLWGMTGTGKTHLVRQLLTALDLDDRTVWLDGGRLARSNFGTNALDPVYESHNGRPFVVVIDEFQHARSKQQMTVEDRGVMRSIWELIDGGKITVHDGERHLEVLLDLRDVLRRALERGMQVKGGRIVAGLELYEELCDETLGRPKDAAEAPWLIPKEHWQWMRSALERPVMSLSAFMDLMQGLDSGNVLPFVEQLVLSCSMPRVLDASQALVIVLGNLDELYALGEELVPELDPDVLVARHEHIGLTGLQEALYKLFRIEQVARLGSEQFAVPPLSRGRLLAVARTHGDALCGRLRESTGVQVRLGDSFLASVVRGHAIAVLGARPLLNALDRLVPGLMVQAEQHARHLGLPLNAVDIDAVDGGLRLSLRGGKRPQRLCLPLPPGPLDAQGPVHAVHAVHEAGHAVVGLALQGTIPRARAPEVRERLTDCVDDLQQVIQEIRTAIFDLHGGHGGSNRLRQRLDEAIAQFTASDVHTTVQFSGPLSVVDPALSDHAEAVVREAVSNAIRHSGATTLDVSVTAADELIIEVADDGCGMPADVTESGLTNLRQRAGDVGGTFTVESGDAGGTRLRWCAPLR